MRLDGRIILITGASRGLGAAMARACARAGASVVATARTQGSLEALDDELRGDGVTLTLLPLDLTEGDKLDRLGLSIMQRFGRLDGLVHAAAVLDPLSPLVHTDPSVVSRSLNLNVLATHRLIRAVDAPLRAAPAARALFVTDAIADGGRPFFGVYAAAKAAQKALVRAYAAELASTPVRVNLVQPPPMSTRLRETAYPGEPRSRQKSPDTVAAMALPLLSPACNHHGETMDLSAATPAV